MSAVRPQSAAGVQDGRPLSNTSINLPQTPGTGDARAGATPRPATAGLATSRSSISSHSPRNAGTPPVDTGPHRDAMSYFDTFKKEELRELIAQSTASWLLSPDFRGQAGLPCGFISNLTISQENQITLLIPKQPDVPNLEYRELHQIIRELTSGIYGGNQLPSLCLEPNFDLSSSCQMPAVYKDTRVGQVLLAVDYAIKALWHGAHVTKKKRAKLAQSWRTLLDVNSATGEFNKAKNPVSEFSTAGQEYVTGNSRLRGLYDKLNTVDPSEKTATKENLFFNTYSDNVKCVMSTSVSRTLISPVHNVMLLHATYDVTSSVTLPDHDHISPVALQRLRRRIRHQLSTIREGLMRDPSTRRNIALLQFITSVSILLVALRRRLMRIPDLDGLLTQLSGDTTRTESEIPPFAIGPKGVHPCETFTVDRTGERRKLAHAHGEIQMDVDTDDLQSFQDQDWCKGVRDDAANHLAGLLSSRPRQEYAVPTVQMDNKDYYVVRVPLTTYYPASPPIPAWLHARYQLISNLRPRKLPMNDLQIAEMFKRVFGFRQALANKSLDASLKLSCCRGIVAPFINLVKKTASSSLFSPDLQGMTLLHHACIHNKTAILSVLLNQKPNLNTRRTEINVRSTQTPNDKFSVDKDLLNERVGATPLHFAARCGALECLTALLASKVLMVVSDSRGYSAIHHACAADQLAIARAILRRHPNLLELPATGGDNSTPLLVAASSGSLQTLRFLVEKKANVTARDVNDDGPVQRAALSFHTDVLEYLVKVQNGDCGMKVENSETLEVWQALVEMLRSPYVSRQDASLRCLEVLLHCTPTYWRPLLDAGAVIPLVRLLQSGKRRPKSGTSSVDSGFGRDSAVDDDPSSPIRSLSCSVICLMSEQDDVRYAIAQAGAIPTLISLLKPAVSCNESDPEQQNTDESLDERCEIQSRSSVVLSDLAHVSDNATRIAEHGGIRPLVNLLQVDVVDVLVNVINTLSALCRGDRSGAGGIQSRIVECGAPLSLAEFLTVRDDSLQAATADAIAAVCDGNKENQDEFAQIGVLTPLVSILRGHCIQAQLKAALAVDSLTRNNPLTQEEAREKGAPLALCRLFQIWSDEVKERGACALWALAGDHPRQQREIAQRIGTGQIKDMLLSKSDTLQTIGCRAVAAWSHNSIGGQKELACAQIVPPLIRLLRLERTSRDVVLCVIQAINNMCIGVAHLNNKNSQLLIAEEGAIELLTNRMWMTSRDELMQVELINCLACVSTGCPDNEERLNESDGFGFEILLQVLNSMNMKVKFRASCALALFAFNRLPQQQKISRLGGLSLTTFDQLFDFSDPIVQAGAAFQLVVLARVVSNTSIVDASARGIITLVNFLDSPDDDVMVVAADYLASLAHTRAGVPDAIVTCGAVAKLLTKLNDKNDQVRQAASQALGYLSFNRTASRELMTSCRASEGLYQSLCDNLGEDGRVADEFVAEFKRQSAVGLPIAKERQRPSRPQTAQAKGNRLNINSRKNLRARSISPAARPIPTRAAGR